MSTEKIQGAENVSNIHNWHPEKVSDQLSRYGMLIAEVMPPHIPYELWDGSDGTANITITTYPTDEILAVWYQASKLQGVGTNEAGNPVCFDCFKNHTSDTCTHGYSTVPRELLRSHLTITLET